MYNKIPGKFTDGKVDPENKSPSVLVRDNTSKDGSSYNWQGSYDSQNTIEFSTITRWHDVTRDDLSSLSRIFFRNSNIQFWREIF